MEQLQAGPGQDEARAVEREHDGSLGGGQWVCRGIPDVLSRVGFLIVFLITMLRHPREAYFGLWAGSLACTQTHRPGMEQLQAGPGQDEARAVEREHDGSLGGGVGFLIVFLITMLRHPREAYFGLWAGSLACTLVARMLAAWSVPTSKAVTRVLPRRPAARLRPEPGSPCS
jgi:hypothetical protein